MIVVGGHVRVEASRRDQAVDAFASLVVRARAQNGCVDFSIGADPSDSDRINIFECWRDQDCLDAWRRIAKGPRVALLDTCVKLFRTGHPEDPLKRRSKPKARHAERTEP